MNRQAILTLEGITKTFPLPDSPAFSRQKFYALDEVSFTLQKNDFIVLGGANGSGKSLLMAIIADLIKPSKGKIYRNGSIGLVFQNPDTQILGETPLEDVSIGPKNLGIPKKQLYPLCIQTLGQVGLQEKAHFPATSLSGGEKRRLATAGILAMNKDIIIFDEPFANLDYPGVQQTNALFAQLYQEGKTLLVLTHEIEKCLGMATGFMVLYKGKLVFNGSPEEGLNQNLETWAIRNPLQQYGSLQDLIWR